MLDRSDVCADLLAAPVPVLPLDTASIADVVRQPMRARVPVQAISACATLSRKATAMPRQVCVIAAEPVVDEWLRVRDSEQGRAEDAVSELERSLRAWRAAFEQVFPVVAPDSAVDRRLFSFVPQLTRLAQELIESALVLRLDVDSVMRARNRSKALLAPASKGKRETEDCVIIEQYFAFCREARAIGFRERIVFVTSNTTDYGEPAQPKPPLDAEFRAVGLTLAHNLAHALALITAPEPHGS